MRSVARFAVTIPAVATMAWLGSAAIATGMAGSTAYAAAEEMATWSASGAPPGGESSNWVASDLEMANRREPNDPNVEELLGSISLRRIQRPGFLDEALSHYRRSLQLRPTSAYGWAEFAAAQYHKGDTGQPFQVALRNAAELGPAEMEVQRAVVDLGLAVWDEASPATREAVERTVTGAMKREPGEVLQIAGRRGRLAVACRHLSDASRPVEPEWRTLCRSTEAIS